MGTEAKPPLDGDRPASGEARGAAPTGSDGAAAPPRVVLLQQILDSLEEAILLLDRHGRITHANRRAAVMFGCPADELLDSEYLALLPPAGRESGRRLLLALRDGDLPSVDLERPHVRRDGAEFWGHLAGRRFHDTGGRDVGLILVVSDVTERRAAVAALRESEEKFRALVETSSDWIWEVDENGVYTYASPKVQEVLGFQPGEVVGKTPFDFMLPDEKARVAAFFLSHARRVEPFSGLENVNLRKDGQPVVLETSGVPVLDPAGRLRGYRGIDRDVTERKRSEQALRESQERYRRLYEGTPVMMHSIDREGRLVSVSDTWLRQLGYTREEVIGRRSVEFLTEPSRRHAEEVVLPAYMESGVCTDVAYQFVRKDGTVIDTLLSAIAERDASGAFVRSLAVVIDVTEQRALEEERLRAQKLESIGTLAGGIAHDFNNLLQGVFGYLSMARLTIDRPLESLGMLEKAEQALHQSVSLTSQLLTFAKGGRPLKKVIALRPVLESAVGLALSGSRVTAEVSIADDLWPVDADQGQISQAIHNLVLNAKQAMSLGGTVRVSARNLPSAEPRPGTPGGGAGQVEIAIRDEGAGIAAEHLPRIYDPYFTTKEKGSGLGLATVYSIVRSHGGTVAVASKPGGGATTFTVLLPAAGLRPEPGPEASATPASRPAAAGAPRSGRVLVMDDEPVVRDVAGALIRALGHAVSFAENGEAALERYREAAAAGRPFDVVILDLTIRGGMGGAETIRRLREIDPGVKAVVSSGYASDGVVADHRRHGFSAALSKPYTLAGLRDVLDGLLRRS